MLLLLFVIFSFVLINFCLGDFLLKIAKICKCEFDIDRYIFQDKVILGVSFLVLLISFINCYLPINEITFTVFFIFSILYLTYILCTKQLKIDLSRKVIIWSIVALFFTVFTTLIIHDSWDSKYYHMQFIESMYRFPLIKGLGNLEDRFGFNSSFFVLYPLFSFKSFLGFHVFELNSILFLLILWYLIYQLSRNYSIVNIFYLSVLILFYSIQGKLLDTTSNDSTVVLLGFYISLRYVFSTIKFTQLALLFIFVPCLMVTSKLSSMFFLCFSTLVLINLVRNKYKYTAIFSIVISFLLLAVWFYRNVYISGYLLYPISSIDLFDVPWKVPKIVAMVQQDYINEYAVHCLNENLTKLFIFKFCFKIQFILLLLINLSILLTPFLIFYFFRKKDKQTIILLSILFIAILFSFIKAPDFRFYSTYYYPLLIVGLTPILRPKAIHRRIKDFIILVCIGFTIGTFIGFNKKNIKYYYKNGNYICRLLRKPILGLGSFRKPNEQLVNYNKDVDLYTIQYFKPLDLNDFHTYELFPSSSYSGFYTDVNPAEGIRIQPIESIELIGTSVKDGFKTKSTWTEKLEKNKSSLFEDYKQRVTSRLNTEIENLYPQRYNNLLTKIFLLKEYTDEEKKIIELLSDNTDINIYKNNHYFHIKNRQLSKSNSTFEISVYDQEQNKYIGTYFILPKIGNLHTINIYDTEDQPFFVLSGYGAYISEKLGQEDQIRTMVSNGSIINPTKNEKILYFINKGYSPLIIYTSNKMEYLLQ